MSILKEKLAKVNANAHSCDDGECEGHHEDGLDGLPVAIRRRVYALGQLQAKRGPILSAFRAELNELQKKYLVKQAPLSEARAAIVNGIREPTEEELAGFEANGVEEVSEDGKQVSDRQGIPRFWLQAFMTHPSLSQLITEDDAKALESLKDIKLSYFNGSMGFKLEFFFGPNEFFSNEVLTKEYHLENPEEPGHDDLLYDHAVGCEIKWKPGKNLCYKSISKTQRHRQNNSVRVVRREEPIPSFFHFFIPPVMPEDEDEENVDINDLEERLQVDFDIGEILKNQLVPNAADWFTGRALEYADLDEQYDDEYDDEYDEEMEDEEESEESEEEAPRRRGGRKAASGEKPECKQQ